MNRTFGFILGFGLLFMAFISIFLPSVPTLVYLGLAVSGLVVLAFTPAQQKNMRQYLESFFPGIDAIEERVIDNQREQARRQRELARKKRIDLNTINYQQQRDHVEMDVCDNVDVIEEIVESVIEANTRTGVDADREQAAANMETYSSCEPSFSGSDYSSSSSYSCSSSDSGGD